MALVKEDAVQRVEVHDGWVDIKANLSIGAVLGMVKGSSLAALTSPTPETISAMLSAAIVAWSYDDLVTPENIARLDMAAALEVLDAINQQFMGTEKKDVASSIPSNGAGGPTISSISGSSIG